MEDLTTYRIRNCTKTASLMCRENTLLTHNIERYRNQNCTKTASLMCRENTLLTHNIEIHRDQNCTKTASLMCRENTLPTYNIERYIQGPELHQDNLPYVYRNCITHRGIPDAIHYIQRERDPPPPLHISTKSCINPSQLRTLVRTMESVARAQCIYKYYTMTPFQVTHPPLLRLKAFPPPPTSNQLPLGNTPTSSSLPKQKTKREREKGGPWQ